MEREKSDWESDRFRLLVSYSDDVWRGFFQFGTIPGEKFKPILAGSLNCLGDEYFLGGYINYLQECGCKGDYYLIVNPKDVDFVLNRNKDES